MKPAVVACLALIASALTAAERPIELRLADPKLRVLFKGLTQAGEKTQSLEVRALFTPSDPGGKLVDFGTHFYVVFDPDNDTAFWAPMILKEVMGFQPIMSHPSPDVVLIDYHAGAHAHLRQTWRLLAGKTPILEKQESMDGQDIPIHKNP